MIDTRLTTASSPPFVTQFAWVKYKRLHPFAFFFQLPNQLTFLIPPSYCLIPPGRSHQPGFWGRCVGWLGLKIPRGSMIYDLSSEMSNTQYYSMASPRLLAPFSVGNKVWHKRQERIVFLFWSMLSLMSLIRLSNKVTSCANVSTGLGITLNFSWVCLSGCIRFHDTGFVVWRNPVIALR